MVRIVTLNCWGLGHPNDYMARRGITRGAAPGSVATTRPLSATAAWLVREQAIVALLRAVAPDVVALQEIVRQPDQWAGASTADRLADALGWECLVGLSGDEVATGQAILAPRPLTSLGVPFHDAPYGALAVRAHTANGRPLAVVSMHLPLDTGSTAARERRARGAARVLAWCAATPADLPVVVAGDFNSAPGTRVVEAFLDAGFVEAGMAATGQAIATMPAHAPVVPLDYILVRGGRARTCRAIGDTPDADGYYPSDHLGLVADLALDDGPPAAPLSGR